MMILFMRISLIVTSLILIYHILSIEKRKNEEVDTKCQSKYWRDYIERK